HLLYYPDTFSFLTNQNKLPTDYSYRQYTEILVKEKADIVNQIESVAEIEKKIDCGQIEELILQADKELKLVRNFLDWKPWEPLLNKNFANQWSWPPMLSAIAFLAKIKES
ncbi:hypothetical protein TSAR_015285, partial [Trichomalopsis sarcophagae]